jgi:carboxymethylenebutenolidase
MNPLKNIALSLLVIVFALASFAAEAPTFLTRAGGETVQGMLYTPPGKGPFPAIIVIHEYWGLNEWVKEQASKLSDQG